jgi:prepilin peptidase CpaA
MTALWDQSLWQVPWVIAVLSSLAAAWSDLRTRRIPNVLTGPLLLCGLAWSATSAGWEGLAEGFVGMALMALPYVLLYAYAGGGAGDAKMTAALGAWLGPIGGAIALASVALAGGVLAIGLAITQRRGRLLATNLGAAALGLTGFLRGHVRRDDAAAMIPSSEQMQPMPYGAAIAVGVVAAAGGVWIWQLS